MKLVNWNNTNKRMRIKDLKQDNKIIQAILSGDPKMMSRKYRQGLKRDNILNNYAIEKLSN